MRVHRTSSCSDLVSLVDDEPRYARVTYFLLYLVVSGHDELLLAPASLYSGVTVCF
jgi:hypothetical protein